MDMAHGTSETKCFTQSTYVYVCACVLKGNQLQGANVEYVLLNREKPEATPFTRWDLHYTISIYLTK